jgi:hypothetical protein
MGRERIEEIWHFPDFDVDLSTGRLGGSPPGSGGAEASRWYPFIRGEQDLQYLCKHLQQPIVAARTAAPDRRPALTEEALGKPPAGGDPCLAFC